MQFKIDLKCILFKSVFDVSLYYLCILKFKLPNVAILIVLRNLLSEQRKIIWNIE